MAQRKRLIWGTLILLLTLIGYFIYQVLFPSSPVLDIVPNPIRDRATTSKEFDEASIPKNSLKEAFFGDLHVHTNLSFDAFIGGTIATPDDAYRYAKGEAIDVLGRKTRINRPLDFAGVSDHSEFIGEFYALQTPGTPGYYAMAAQVIRQTAGDEEKGLALFKRLRSSKTKERKHMAFFKGYETTKKAWDVILEAAENHYQPEEFTTLVGYEWSMKRNEGHLHRNVFFRDMIVPDYPISSLEANTAEKLWESLAQYTKGGATVLAIPHNTNLSKGQAFPTENSKGQPLDDNYVKARNKWEPLIEIHQAKGNAEVHAQFWKNDEFADFENYNFLPPKENNYVRYALKKGLEYQHKLGVNPYKFGLIGSTDSHNATPGATEESSLFNSNHTVVDNTPENRRNREWVLSGSELDEGKMVYEALNPGGLVGVWAGANTRGEIWDALKRKETFATSGGRIKVRFFGGYAFEDSYTTYENLVQAGYEKGVPMGSDLSNQAATNNPPSFIIWASKDNESANLDRIQLIKGWYKEGVLQEKIFTVALSDNRVLNEDGSVPDLAAKVDMETGAWDKSKGASVLQTVWTDPEFDPAVEAFYYVRVLELPTPRWTLWDKIRAGISFPADVDMITVERAWSSPIWYAPN